MYKSRNDKPWQCHNFLMREQNGDEKKSVACQQRYWIAVAHNFLTNWFRLLRFSKTFDAAERPLKTFVFAAHALLVWFPLFLTRIIDDRVELLMCAQLSHDGWFIPTNRVSSHRIWIYWKLMAKYEIIVASDYATSQ